MVWVVEKYTNGEESLNHIDISFNSNEHEPFGIITEPNPNSEDGSYQEGDLVPVQIFPNYLEGSITWEGIPYKKRNNEYLGIKRRCFNKECNKELNFKEIRNANPSKTKEELERLWLDLHVEFYCCHCYRKKSKKEQLLILVL